MPDNNCQKIKLLKIVELLRQETDEQHPIGDPKNQQIQRLYHR